MVEDVHHRLGRQAGPPRRTPRCPFDEFLRLSDRRTDLEDKVRIVERELDAELAQITVETDENDPESVRTEEQNEVELIPHGTYHKSHVIIIGYKSMLISLGI